MAVLPGMPSSAFRSSLDRFQDVSSYRKGRCRREEKEYRDLGPAMYDRPSMMELQQARPKTMGSIPGGSSTHRSTVTRKGINWYPGRRDYPNLGPGVYHQASRMFLAKKEAVMFLPGSRRGFHSFLNSGRSKRLMGDAVLFQTARSDGQHLGPGSYDLPSTLRTGRRPTTAPEPAMPAVPGVPHALSGARRADRDGRLGGPRSTREGKGHAASVPAASSARPQDARKGKASSARPQDARKGKGAAGLLRQVHLDEERVADMKAVRALPNITVTATGRQ